MNTIGKNIKHLRKQHGLTQDDFARKLGIKRAVVGSYEEGRAIPKLPSLQDIARFFGLSLDELVSPVLRSGEKAKKDIFPGDNIRVLSTVVNADNKELVTLVPEKASAGYTNGYGDPEYIEKLPVFSFPLPELSRDQTYRIFQISGDSMLPVEPGSYIICEYVLSPDEIKDGSPYIVITKTDGIVYKRVYHGDKDSFMLKSDNPVYKSYTIEKAEILEIWKAFGYISFNLPEPGDESDLTKLFSVISDIQTDLDTIKKKI
jgi:transcriptional regulator with XRE-family HTH domain